MIIEIKIPSPGESITEVEIGRWMAEEGSLVRKGQEIAEVESDKATLTIIAEGSGKLTIVAREGETVAVGSVACTIDTSMEPTDNEGDAASSGTAAQASAKEVTPRETPASPETPPEDHPRREAAANTVGEEPSPEASRLKITAVAREVMKEHNLSVDDLLSGLKRIGRREVEEVVALAHRPGNVVPPAPPSTPADSRETAREKMSLLRRRLSERLVSVKNETAMLTTFNEADMSALMEMRREYQLKFTEKHGLKLGFMAFFTKAAALAMQYHPSVNSQIDGDDILTPRFVDVGIAVQTPRGLMVPVVRNAESKTLPQIEQEIKELAEKARTKKITVEELSGGTFTITNGGVFGSLLSTPIINPPQSAILGMHNIVERPVAVNGKVEIRPMMYIALSYDHRIIDGKDSVGFLVRLKEMIEDPRKMVFLGKDPAEMLLGI